MNNVLQFLTSTQCIVIYIIAGISCLLCILIYSYENTKDKRRKKQNTDNLNKLVEEVNEEEDFDYSYNEVPVLETVTNTKEDEVISTIAPSKEEVIRENRLVVPTNKEETIVETMVNEIKKEESTPVNEFKSENSMQVEEELQYTSMVPTKEEAKKEIESLTKRLELEELKKEEFFNEEDETPVIEEVKTEENKVEVIEESNNIELTDYEVEQEENAIISLEELTKKGKEMYESNEVTQYLDEGNEPISLQDLEAKMNKQMEEVKETFEIEAVADKPTQEEIDDMLDGTMPIKVEEINKKVKMDDFNSIKTTKKYTPTPVISPIYGIEKNVNSDIELENTSDYEKLDAEIKKTNEFIMTLKELQKNME